MGNFVLIETIRQIMEIIKNIYGYYGYILRHVFFINNIQYTFSTVKVTHNFLLGGYMHQNSNEVKCEMLF